METRQLSEERMRVHEELTLLVQSVETDGSAEAKGCVLEILLSCAATERRELGTLARRHARLLRELAALEKELAAAKAQQKSATLRQTPEAERIEKNKRLLTHGRRTKERYLAEIAALTTAIEQYTGTSPKRYSAESTVLASSPASRPSDAEEDGAAHVGRDCRAAARVIANQRHRRETELSAVQRELASLRRSNELLQGQVETLRSGGPAADALFAQLCQTSHSTTKA